MATMIALKAGVKLADLTSQMVLAVVVVSSVYTALNEECVITSCNDGKHMKGSRHYTGEACDFRLRHISAQVLRDKAASWVRSALGTLGGNYTVLHEYPGTEREHIHVEYAPK